MEGSVLIPRTRSVLGVLLAARVRALRNRMANLHDESIFKIVVVAGMGLAFWLGLFFFFRYAFNFLNTNAHFIREVLMSRMFSLFFLALLLMLVFSNALISFSNLFRNPETKFLFSHPVRHDTIYLYKMVESLVFSSWALFALGLPLLLAYGLESEATWYFYPAIVVFLVPFVVIPAAVGALIGLLLTAVVPRHRGKVLGLLVLFAVGVAAYIAMDLLNLRGGGPDLGAEVRGGAMHLVIGKLEFTQHPMTPNFWISQGLLALAESGRAGLSKGAWFLAALFSSALLSIVIGWFVAGSIYAGTYSLAGALSAGKRRAYRGLLDTLTNPFVRRWPAVTVLILKDIKTFLRDPVQWSQVLIFFGLLAIYIANLRNFSYPIERPFYQILISFLNLGATCLTLATMVSRFVFPLISLEGQRFWIMGLVPVERRSILLAKFLFSLLGALVLTESLVVLSSIVLKSDPFILQVQMLTAAMLCVGLTGMSVGMGAIFPSLREPNPSKIVSGFGGTLTLIISISMVMLMVAVEAFVCHRYLVMQNGFDPASDAGQSFRSIMWAVVALNATICGLAAYVPMRLGARALDRLEF